MFVYIIECKNHSLYTGIAKDVKQRLSEHFFKLKPCAKYTKSHSMIGVKAIWKTNTWQNASKLEYQIKNLSRIKKLELIERPSEIYKIIANAQDFESLKSNEIKQIFKEISKLN